MCSWFAVNCMQINCAICLQDTYNTLKSFLLRNLTFLWTCQFMRPLLPGETDITDLVPFGFFLCYSPETRKALWEYINTARWFFLPSCIYTSVVEMPFGVWLQSIEIKCVWDSQIRGRKEALEANSKWTGRSLTRPKLIDTYFGRRGGFFMYCLTIGSLLYCMWANWKCFYWEVWSLSSRIPHHMSDWIL